MLQKPQHYSQHPLTYQQWTCCRNLNISTSTPSPMNTGHAAETSTLQPAPLTYAATVDMLQKPQHYSQHPLTYQQWTCCRNLNISTSTPSPMKTGHAAETSTLQPAPPHLSTVDMLQKPQHLNQHPLTYEQWTCCRNLNNTQPAPPHLSTVDMLQKPQHLNQHPLTYEQWTCYKNLNNTQPAPLTYQQWTCYRNLNISTSTPSPMNSGHATKTSTLHSQHPSPINSGHATETSTSQPAPPHL